MATTRSMDKIDNVFIDEIQTVGDVGIIVGTYSLGIWMGMFSQSYEGFRGKKFQLHIWAEVMQNICDSLTLKMALKYGIKDNDIYLGRNPVWCAENSCIMVTETKVNSNQYFTFHDRNESTVLAEIVITASGDVYSIQCDQQMLDCHKLAIGASRKNIENPHVFQGGTHGLGLKQMFALVMSPEKFGICVPYSLGDAVKNRQYFYEYRKTGDETLTPKIHGVVIDIKYTYGISPEPYSFSDISDHKTTDTFHEIGDAAYSGYIKSREEEYTIKYETGALKQKADDLIPSEFAFWLCGTVNGHGIASLQPVIIGENLQDMVGVRGSYEAERGNMINITDHVTWTPKIQSYINECLTNKNKNFFMQRFKMFSSDPEEIAFAIKLGHIGMRTNQLHICAQNESSAIIELPLYGNKWVVDYINGIGIDFTNYDDKQWESWDDDTMRCDFLLLTKSPGNFTQKERGKSINLQLFYDEIGATIFAHSNDMNVKPRLKESIRKMTNKHIDRFMNSVLFLNQYSTKHWFAEVAELNDKIDEQELTKNIETLRKEVNDNDTTTIKEIISYMFVPPLACVRTCTDIHIINITEAFGKRVYEWLTAYHGYWDYQMDMEVESEPVFQSLTPATVYDKLFEEGWPSPVPFKIEKHNEGIAYLNFPGDILPYKIPTDLLRSYEKGHNKLMLPSGKEFMSMARPRDHIQRFCFETIDNVLKKFYNCTTANGSPCIVDVAFDIMSLRKFVTCLHEAYGTPYSTTTDVLSWETCKYFGLYMVRYGKFTKFIDLNRRGRLSHAKEMFGVEEIAYLHQIKDFNTLITDDTILDFMDTIVLSESSYIDKWNLGIIRKPVWVVPKLSPPISSGQCIDHITEILKILTYQNSDVSGIIENTRTAISKTLIEDNSVRNVIEAKFKTLTFPEDFIRHYELPNLIALINSHYSTRAQSSMLERPLAAANQLPGASQSTSLPSIHQMLITMGHRPAANTAPQAAAASSSTQQGSTGRWRPGGRGRPPKSAKR